MGRWGGGQWEGEGEGGEELARARSGKERGSGRVDKKEWGGERGDRIGTMGRRPGGGNGEGKMEEQLEGGEGEGGNGKGETGGGQRGGGEEGARGGGILQMDMI